MDLIIRNALVYDGSGAPAFVADVAVKDGVIAAVGEVAGQGCEEIDGSGLALAPGFIDAHSHAESQVFADPRRLCKLQQGITTEVAGQCGWSRGPADRNMTEEFRSHMAASEWGMPERAYASFRELLDAVADMRPGAHQISFAGHNIIRGSVMGMDDRPPTAEELERMKALLESAMQEGALGMSSGLVYAPGIYSDTEELIELAKVVAKYDGIYTTHIRDEADRLIPAVEEAIRIAKEARVRVNISHMKVMYDKNRHMIREALQLIENANAEGCDITFDVYPYAACSAPILSTLPPSYLTRGMDWLAEELGTPEGVARLEKAIMEPTEVWENPLLNAGFDRDMIATAPATPDAAGKLIHDYALEKGMSDVEAYAYIIAKNRGDVQDIRFLMHEENLALLYRHPLCMPGTDGLYVGDGELSHPRGLASFPRYLGRFIREQRILSREEGVRRITGLPADRYGLKTKGYIRPGYDADLVLFDFETIIDRATYTEPFLPNEGIEMVFVSGQAAVVKNQPTGVCNGKVYRRSGTPYKKASG